MPFEGHDKSESSTKRDHFLNFLKWHAESNENVRSVLRKAPLNHKMTSRNIQRDSSHSCAKETIGKMLEEFRDGYFAILVDESHMYPANNKWMLSCDMLI